MLLYLLGIAKIYIVIIRMEESHSWLYRNQQLVRWALIVCWRRWNFRRL